MLVLSTAIVAGLALAPLWMPAPGRGGWAARVLLTLAAAAAVLLASLAPSVDTTPSPTRPLETPSEGYVGSRACRSCHPEQHATWHDSFHRTMTQVASRDAVVAKIDKLRLDWCGTTVEPGW